MTKKTGEFDHQKFKARWEAASKLVSKNVDQLGNLADRWKEEYEYEDWDDYVKAIKKTFPKFELYKFRKSMPFGFSIKIGEGAPDMVVKVLSEKVVWGRHFGRGRK
jgi:hypothetical protein